MRVIVTRPQAQAEDAVVALARAGIDAVALPLIDICALPDRRPLQQAWRELAEFALAMFVSANAVQQFMRERPAGFEWPPAVLAGSTGPGTSAALRAAGVPPWSLVEPVGEVFDSEALWVQLQNRAWTGRRVLIVRGDGGRDWLAEQLRRVGATVSFVAAYARRLPQWDARRRALLQEALARPADSLWLFSSAEAVRNLGRLSPGADWSGSAAVASHVRVASEARALGFAQVDLGDLDASAVARRLSAPGSRSIQSDAS